VKIFYKSSTMTK